MFTFQTFVIFDGIFVEHVLNKVYYVINEETSTKYVTQVLFYIFKKIVNFMTDLYVKKEEN